MGIFPLYEKDNGTASKNRPKVTPGERILAEGLAKTIQIRIYEDIGGHYVLIYKRNVSYRREALRWGGAEYVLNKDKVIYEREVFTQRLRPCLFFRYNDAAPMGLPLPRIEPMVPEQSMLRMDARKVATVANRNAWKNLYPSTDTMLQIIALVSVVGLLVSIGLNAYLLGDPDASDNLRNIVKTNNGGTATNDKNPDGTPKTSTSTTTSRDVPPFKDPGEK